jgi:hypothetical protein
MESSLFCADFHCKKTKIHVALPGILKKMGPVTSCGATIGRSGALMRYTGRALGIVVEIQTGLKSGLNWNNSPADAGGMP